jgi:hypothetical protein
LIVILAAGNAGAAPPPEAPSRVEASAQEAHRPEAPLAATASRLEEKNAELLKRHTEIWGLMGLSARAQEELNEAVVSINTGLHENENRRPEPFDEAMNPRRRGEPLTYEDFVSGHKRRFALLKISGATQVELLAALDFTWKALHDPDVPEEKRAVAEKIRGLMISMGGPPPCCDDSIFERAGMAE